MKKAIERIVRHSERASFTLGPLSRRAVLQLSQVRCRCDHSPRSGSAACSQDTAQSSRRSRGQQELDLFQLAASFVTQPRACSAEIVWGDAGHCAFRTSVFHYTPDDFRAKPVRGDSARFFYRPKDCSRTRFAAVIHDCKPETSHVGIGIVRT
jgi:hypothetical protein